MFETDTELPIITKSLPTAGAILAATGVRPTIHRRREGISFEFPQSVEPALVAFLKAKRVLDQMIEEAK